MQTEEYNKDRDKLKGTPCRGESGSPGGAKKREHLRKATRLGLSCRAFGQLLYRMSALRLSAPGPSGDTTWTDDSGTAEAGGTLPGILHLCRNTRTGRPPRLPVNRPYVPFGPHPTTKPTPSALHRRPDAISHDGVTRPLRLVLASVMLFGLRKLHKERDLNIATSN